MMKKKRGRPAKRCPQKEKMCQEKRKKKGVRSCLLPFIYWTPIIAIKEFTYKRIHVKLPV